MTLVDARFPSREATTAFLVEVDLWNAVTGLPRIRVRSAVQRNRVILRGVASARRGIVHLVEAFGGDVVNELAALAKSTDRARDVREEMHDDSWPQTS